MIYEFLLFGEKIALRKEPLTLVGKARTSQHEEAAGGC
jgi:hypothetical protein